MQRRFPGMTLVLGMVLIGLLGGCTVYGLPPGHGGIPPGHGGIPPGQAKKMGPPPIVLVGAPTYVVVPGTNIFVMGGVEADVFRENGMHYYFYQGAWYEAAHYWGPWKAIASSHLPPGLAGKSPKALKAKVKGRGKRNQRR